ncbi:MAG TPA: ATP-binding cassette domain-containing protein, partial [Actinoplanes sp.]|nr:ATP-binding cassette domain-containing protein [Actinoplanes sp.]
MTTLAISANGLRKSYGDKVVLDGVDLAVPEGTIFALLGPNGAGKTTAVKILSTLITKDAGDVRVGGHDLAADPQAVRAAIGVTGQFSAVDGLITGAENMLLMADLHHLARAEGRRVAAALLERFDLADAAAKPAATYSGGMKRRLDIAMTLVGNPRIIFLDEPTTGLDPRSRLALWETIEGRVAEGTTVLLTTQYLDEADALADRISVIDQGRVIAEGSSDELKDQVGGERLDITLESKDEAEKAIAALAPIAAEAPAMSDGLLRMPVAERKGALDEAVRRLNEAGVGIDDLALRRPTLDDVFLHLTGHAAEGEDGDRGDHVPPVAAEAP